jgi:hypothetical protein
MSGVLDEVFRTRTNGNGYIEQEWDHIMLKRDLAQLLAEGGVEEVSCPPGKHQKWPDEFVRRRFRDSQTSDIYEYTGPWDRGRPRFYRLTSDHVDG